MNVLSLFDGISCAAIACERANLKVDKYYTSEIDKYATAISLYKYPFLYRLGDVNNITSKEVDKIDLLVGGSPCQGFSAAGHGQNFKDVRSKLFWEYVRVLNDVQPKYFLLENVSMKKEWQDVISNAVGVEPIKLNSALVSAQSRIRLYWTNIPNIVPPTDKGIYLKDVIEHGLALKDKSVCIDANYYKGGSVKNYLYKLKNGLPTHESERRLLINVATIGKGGQGQRVYSTNGKSTTMLSSTGGFGTKTGLYVDGELIRKLSPLEAERCQTIPDDYTRLGDFNGTYKLISNLQRYKAIGNAFTVDMIAHIFRNI
jgi:site-specific DNA-cytosine methylase